MKGFEKWLNSTKFQVALMVIWLIFIDQQLFGLDAKTAATLLKDVALGYFAARVLEPVVEKIAGGIFK
jgi:hypothetical protein